MEKQLADIKRIQDMDDIPSEYHPLIWEKSSSNIKKPFIMGEFKKPPVHPFLRKDFTFQVQKPQDSLK